ncbi:hypothetical protein M9Y10_032764 [Tritrichomonas musculus]|uniref:MORN repeat-containing protein 1 n=1 Tax=Tritrichomonas musculus TaxID=1915356 RepID=A0ABR2GXS1_9EUKA
MEEEDLPVHGPNCNFVFPPQKDGRAIYNYPNSFFKYKGEWKNGKKEGQGRFYIGPNSYYEGEFVNGEITGNGSRYFENGSYYFGDFQKGEFNGRGVFTDVVTGEEYEGEWKDNRRNGEGVLQFSDGSKYIGHFLNHKRDGQGQYTDKEGNHYIGEWKNNMIEGEGQMTYANGDIYMGEFKKGLRDGWGTIKFASTGLSFTGDWKEDLSQYNPTEMVVPNLPPIIPGATLNNVKIHISGGKGETGRVLRVSIEISKNSLNSTSKKLSKTKKLDATGSQEPQYLIVDHQNNQTFIDLIVTKGIALLQDVIVPADAEQATYILNIIDQSKVNPLPPFSANFVWMTSAERSHMKSKTRRSSTQKSNLPT